MTDENREERLDSPLVVHKKDDASYRETAVEVDMSSTHGEEDADAPTLERHRFRKEKKSHSGIWVLFAFIAVAAAVVCALFYSGKLTPEKEVTEPSTQRSYTTQEVNKFEGIITIKGTYVFFEGKEVDGIKGLEREIKYLDKGTKFKIQDEDANSEFLNMDVLSLLTRYEIEYDITHIVSSGLESEFEKTTQPETQKPSENATQDNESSSQPQ